MVEKSTKKKARRLRITDNEELVAMNQIVSILDTLTIAEQVRVLDYVNAWHEDIAAKFAPCQNAMDQNTMDVPEESQDDSVQSGRELLHGM